MERSRVTRYIRCAVTALSMTACVLLVALWVRSYWRDYVAYGKKANSQIPILVSSTDGQLVLYSSTNPAEFRDINKLEVKSVTDFYRPWGQFLGFGFYYHTVNFQLVVPHWFAALMCTSLAAIPWLHWSKRFSLRTLLIATTLVAVGLGIVVWSS